MKKYYLVTFICKKCNKKVNVEGLTDEDIDNIEQTYKCIECREGKYRAIGSVRDLK